MNVSKTIPLGRLLLAVVLVAALAACGVKKPPRVPKAKPPVAITDLRIERSGDTVYLRWTVPQGKAGGSTGLGGFIVYREDKDLAAAPCEGCPRLFVRIGQIEIEDVVIEDEELQTALFEDVVEDDMGYTYKVVAFSKDGRTGPDSNYVETE